MKSEFKYAVRGERRVRVKGLPAGGEIRKDGDEFYAYDASGRYLGWTTQQDAAEFMAENGFSNNPDEISELSLWTMWNDALNSGERPLEDEDGVQFLKLPGRVVMSAKPDKRGWDVELISETDLWDVYADEDHDDVLRLKFAEKPYRLE